MIYKELKTKELYASIPSTDFIKVMFREGLRMGTTQLAVSAMEELVLRGDTDYVYDGLVYGFTNGYVVVGTSMCTMIGRSLAESCREVDPLLMRYGKALLRGQGGNGPRQWIKTAGLENIAQSFISDAKAATEAAKAAAERIKKMSPET